MRSPRYPRALNRKARMKRYVLGTSVGLVLAMLPTPALSDAQRVNRSTPCTTKYSTRDYKPIVQSVFAGKRWRVGPGQVSDLDYMQRCAWSQHARSQMRSMRQQHKSRFYRYRTLRRVAPYRGYTGYGLGLTWLAIPRAIVDCEGGPDWNRPNSSGSGAYGPYQLLGHGEPIPVNSWHDQIVTHRIARELYVSSGTSPWAASSGCWG